MAYHFSNTLASTLNSLAHTLLAESELSIYPLFFSISTPELRFWRKLYNKKDWFHYEFMITKLREFFTIAYLASFL